MAVMRGIALLLIGCLVATSVPVLAQDETGAAVADAGLSEVTDSQGGVGVGVGTIALGIAALAALGLALSIGANAASSTTTTTSTSTSTTN